MTDPIGLRERKKNATRSALIATAVRLFSRRGFDAVTIDEICAAADVAPRTFFRYFAAKEQVVLHDVQLYKDAFSAVLRAPKADEPPRATARRAAVAVAREIASHRDDLRPRLRLIPQSMLLVATWAALDRFWQEGLAALFEAHRMRDADLLAGAIVGGLNAVLARYFAAPDQDAEALTRRVFDLVGGPKPRRSNS